MKKLSLLLAALLSMGLCSQTWMQIQKVSGEKDSIKLTDISKKSFSTQSGLTAVPCPGVPTVTYEGKTYNTVQIGTQCWLKENLNVGTMIQGNLDETNNGIIEKYCYNDSTTNCETYGGLYQWAEAIQYKNGATNTSGANPALSGNIQGICPPGWHIPSDDDFQIFISSVGAFGRDEVLAISQTFSATNSSGFSALLSGYRNYFSPWFGAKGSLTYIWSSTEIPGVVVVFESTSAKRLHLDISNNYVRSPSGNKRPGGSVRCLKDDTGTAIESYNEKGFPTKYLLSQNYPNPFNPSTVVQYALPYGSNVSVTVYNTLGEVVLKNELGSKTSGYHELLLDLRSNPSGVYFYRLSAESLDGKQKYSSIKKMILLK